MKLKQTIHDNLFKHMGLTFLIIILFLGAGTVIDADWTEVMENHRQATIFLQRFLQPEWSYINQLVEPMIETILMSVSGTFLSVVLEITAALLGTYIVTRNYIITYIFRSFFSLILTITNLLLSGIFVAIIDIVELTWVLTIAVFTFGMVSQLIFVN